MTVMVEATASARSSVRVAVTTTSPSGRTGLTAGSAASAGPPRVAQMAMGVTRTEARKRARQRRFMDFPQKKTKRWLAETEDSGGWLAWSGAARQARPRIIENANYYQ
ncbi:hypothetical protein ACU4HD_21650 [Cupriavidus basilensis]